MSINEEIHSNEKLGALSAEENVKLQQAENVIAAGLKSCFEIGRALRSIQTAKLYREHYNTFDDYVDDRWDLGRSQAYDFIKAANIMDNLVPISAVLPANEHQASQLRKLTPEQQQQAWLKAVENADGGKLTGNSIKYAVDEFLANCAAHDAANDGQSEETTTLNGQLLNQYSVGDYMTYSPKFAEGAIRLVLLTEIMGSSNKAKSEWLTDLIKEIDSAMAADSNILIFSDDVDYRYIVETVEGRGFAFVGSATWIHDGRKIKSECSFVRSRTEVLHFKRGKAKLYTPIEDCINCDIEPLKKHTNQIPLELVKLLIEAATKLGDLVLDPVCRVATTNLACHELSRGCIGIDPEQQSYESGLARMHQRSEDVIAHMDGGAE